MKLSVIVPVYNPSELQLERCIQSIINQRDCIVEIILIDNASVSRCPKILQKYSETYSQVKLVVLSENIGPAGAVKEGLKYVTGDYFLIVDADDFLVDSAGKTLFEITKNNTCDIIIFSHKILMENTQKFEDYIPLSDLNSELFNKCLSSDNVLKFLPKISLTWWNKCYKTDYIKTQYIIPNESLRYVLCDILFSIQAIYSAKSIMIINEQLYVHCIDNTKSSVLKTFAEVKCEYWNAPIILANILYKFLNQYNREIEGKMSIYYILLLHLKLSFDFDKMQILRTIKVFYHYKLLFWAMKFPIKRLKSNYPNKLLYKWFFQVKYMPLLFYLIICKKGKNV